MSDRLVLLSKLIGEGADLFLENDFKEYAVCVMIWKLAEFIAELRTRLLGGVI